MDGTTQKYSYSFRALIVILLMVVCFVGCGLRGLQMTDLASMSPKEKSLWMTKIYNQQFESYQTAVGYRFDAASKRWVKERDVVLTPLQHQFLTEKRAMLADSRILLSTYNQYIITGVIPTKVLEEEALRKINELMLKQLE